MAPPRIDLRSDTVTQPTAEMRRAMAAAELGDDGYGEDPTVRRLEEAFAERLGKQAALFVPSGTMANQIALRILTVPGDVVAAGARQHVVLYELGAAGRNAGIQFALLDDERGALDLEALSRELDGARHHQPVPAAVFIESSHMASGGRCWQLSELAALARCIDGMPVHLDGARLFNAALAVGESPAQLAEAATTVMCCLSKGLCAPVGSLLAGADSLIADARVERKRLGGAMRQAGVLAACGLVALESMVDRLSEDHRRADALGEAVAERWPEQEPRLVGQCTNLVVFEHRDPDALIAHLASTGIGAGVIAPGTVRLVTHAGIDDAAVDEVRLAIASAP
jgi:threonine aldolase